MLLSVSLHALDKVLLMVIFCSAATWFGVTLQGMLRQHANSRELML